MKAHECNYSKHGQFLSSGFCNTNTTTNTEKKNWYALEMILPPTVLFTVNELKLKGQDDTQIKFASLFVWL